MRSPVQGVVGRLDGLHRGCCSGGRDGRGLDASFQGNHLNYGSHSRARRGSGGNGLHSGIGVVSGGGVGDRDLVVDLDRTGEPASARQPAGGRVDVMGDSSDTAQVHPREFTEMAISQSGATVRLNSKVIGVETVPEEGGGRKVTGVKVRGKTTFER